MDRIQSFLAKESVITDTVFSFIFKIFFAVNNIGRGQQIFYETKLFFLFWREKKKVVCTYVSCVQPKIHFQNLSSVWCYYWSQIRSFDYILINSACISRLQKYNLFCISIHDVESGVFILWTVKFSERVEISRGPHRCSFGWP